MDETKYNQVVALKHRIDQLERIRIMFPKYADCDDKIGVWFWLWNNLLPEKVRRTFIREDASQSYNEDELIQREFVEDILEVVDTLLAKYKNKFEHL